MNNNPQTGLGMQPEKPQKRYSMKSSAELITWIMRFSPDCRVALLHILLLCVIISLCNLAIPMLVGQAIDCLYEQSRLAGALLLLGSFYLVTAVCGYRQGILVSRLAQKNGFRLRESLYHKVMDLPVPYIDSHAQGDIMSRMTNDIDAVVQTLSVAIPGLLSSVITALGCMVILLRQSSTIALVNLGIGLAMTVCSSLYSRLMYSQIMRQQQALGELNAVVTESMTQRHSIFAYYRQEKSNTDMQRVSDRMEQIGIRTQVIGAAMEPLMSTLGNISFLVTAIFGGILVISGDITVGMIQACLLYARQLLKPLTELGMMFAQIQGGLACTDRIHSLFDVPEEPDDGHKEFPRSLVRGEIQFDHIRFSYIRGKPVLDGLNLHIAAKETIAIVGKTGAGKTTLMNLLLRFYEPDEGVIRVDETDISEIPRKKLYSTMAVILQDGSMMSDTAADIIAYGNPTAGAEEIQSAASLVSADPFIQGLSDGYDTVISQDGGSLSYGQRQLLCLARIPLMNPRILIFDEATSSVDAHTEQAVQEALNNIKQDRTCIIIAHRLNTVRNADRIVVLDQGHIVEEGKHEDLLRLHGKYYDLYMSSLSDG